MGDKWILPDITCSTCYRWHNSDSGCPAPYSGSQFSCLNHQNYSSYLEISNKAITLLNNQIPFERGGCNKCMTTIWSNQESVTQGDRSYHLTCLILQRAEKAEAEIVKLLHLNNQLREFMKR
jgi:hypothetical protein